MRTMNRALAAPGPVRDGKWLVSVAQLPHWWAVVLADPDQTVGEAELAAIAYGGSLPAVVITRLQNLGRRGCVRIAAVIRSAALGLYA